MAEYLRYNCFYIDNYSRKGRDGVVENRVANKPQVSARPKHAVVEYSCKGEAKQQFLLEPHLKKKRDT